MAISAPVRPQRAWQLLPEDAAQTAAVARALGIGPVAARIMVARGWRDPKALREFLAAGLSGLHDPSGLPDLEVAVARLAEAVRRREPVCIYGDYDVDGTTGSAVLMKTLAWLGAGKVLHRTPHRVKEGYGIHPTAVEAIASEGVRLIVTVDNGTTAHAALERARDLGLEVIVLDHHQCSEALPPALAIVNPWRADSAYPFPSLCGCAVAFKVAQALAKAMGHTAAEAKPFLLDLLDLVALATVADVVPLLGENRAIVRHGLQRLQETRHAGLRALIEAAGLRGRITAENLGWVLGPRLNAAGRTSHASLVVELLTTEDQDRARHLAGHLETLNAERQRIEKAVLEQALAALETRRGDAVIVLAGRGWHQGVLGLVAARIAERAERPALVLSEEGDCLRGSGRSVPGFDLHAALQACAEHLLTFGGHPMAAGLTCAPEQVEPFRRAINAHALAVHPAGVPVAPRTVDAELAESELQPRTVEEIEALGPFGEGHPRPTLLLRGLRLAATPQVIRSVHVKLHLLTPGGRPLTAMAWRRVERLGELIPAPPRLDLIGRPVLNAWNGEGTVEYNVLDWRPATA